MAAPDAVKLLPVGPEHRDALATFFERFAASPAVEFFHPHTLSAAAAQERADYQGKDFYAVLVGDHRVLGYGLLRGWDEGYEVPSLGVAIDEGYRGLGLGRLMMEYLHAVARLRGAPRVRLRVRETNRQAQELYRSMGYTLSSDSDGYMIGYLTLGRKLN